MVGLGQFGPGGFIGPGPELAGSRSEVEHNATECAAPAQQDGGRKGGGGGSGMAYQIQQPHQPTTVEEVRTLWIGDLQYWVDESYLYSCFSQTGEVRTHSLSVFSFFFWGF